MSTSVTKDGWEIVVYDQKELLSGLRWWAVEVWQNHELLGSDNPSRAKCLWSEDNFNWDNYTLTDETLEGLVAKAALFIKGRQE
jgi:hypothetical protein